MGGARCGRAPLTSLAAGAPPRPRAGARLQQCSRPPRARAGGRRAGGGVWGARRGGLSTASAGVARRRRVWRACLSCSRGHEALTGGASGAGLRARQPPALSGSAWAGRRPAARRRWGKGLTAPAARSEPGRRQRGWVRTAWRGRGIKRGVRHMWAGGSKERACPPAHAGGPAWSALLSERTSGMVGHWGAVTSALMEGVRQLNGGLPAGLAAAHMSACLPGQTPGLFQCWRRPRCAGVPRRGAAGGPPLAAQV